MMVSKFNTNLNELFSLKKNDIAHLREKVNFQEPPKKHLSLWRLYEEEKATIIEKVNIYKKIKLKEFKLIDSDSYIFLVIEKLPLKNNGGKNSYFP